MCAGRPTNLAVPGRPQDPNNKAGTQQIPSLADLIWGVRGLNAYIRGRGNLLHLLPTQALVLSFPEDNLADSLKVGSLKVIQSFSCLLSCSSFFSAISSKDFPKPALPLVK